MIEVERNHLLWQTTLNTSAQDMLAMQSQLAAKVRQGLIPAVVGSSPTIETATRPKNSQAYDLYLRSSAISL